MLNDERFITLTTNDNKSFEVPYQIIIECNVFKDMFEGLGWADGEVLHLDNISSKVLQWILSYCKHYFEHGQYRDDDCKKTAMLQDWEQEFLGDAPNYMFLQEVMVASDFLDIEHLTDFLARVLAKAIEGQDVESLRKFFNVENDFTPEEEENIRKEHEWIFRM